MVLYFFFLKYLKLYLLRGFRITTQPNWGDQVYAYHGHQGFPFGALYIVYHLHMHLSPGAFVEAKLKTSYH